MSRFYIIVICIVLIMGCATAPIIVPPYTGPDHYENTEPISKIIAESSSTTVLRRYMLKSTEGAMIGVYKIEIGDQEKIGQALYRMEYVGFNGTTYQPKDEILEAWATAKIDMNDKSGLSTKLKKKQIVILTDTPRLELPGNLGKLSLEHLSLIEAINLYDSYPEAISIMILPGVTIPQAYELMYAIEDVLRKNI